MNRNLKQTTLQDCNNMAVCVTEVYSVISRTMDHYILPKIDPVVSGKMDCSIFSKKMDRSTPTAKMDPSNIRKVEQSISSGNSVCLGKMECSTFRNERFSKTMISTFVKFSTWFYSAINPDSLQTSKHVFLSDSAVLDLYCRIFYDKLNVTNSKPKYQSQDSTTNCKETVCLVSSQNNLQSNFRVSEIKVVNGSAMPSVAVSNPDTEADVLDDDEFQPPTPETALYSILATLGLSWETVEYYPKENRNNGKGIYCKNLFLRDRRGRFYYVMCHEDDTVNLKDLRKSLGAYRNFSFATEDETKSILQVAPGSITPFSFSNQSAAEVVIAMSDSLTANPDVILNFHPMVPEYATRISYRDLVTFLDHFGHSIVRI